MSNPELSIVIPFKDEAVRLPKSLAKILDYADKHLPSVELILVDDGSRDGSQKAIQQYLKDGRVTLLVHAINQGKGAAVRTGVLAAKGKLVLFTDADLATPIKELKKLQTTLSKQHCDLAIGSRAVPGSVILTRQSLFRVLIGKGGNKIIRLVTGLPFHDTQCGFKLFKTNVAQDLLQEQHFPKWSFDIEVLYKAKLKNYTVCEVPVEWADVPGSKVQSFSDPLQVLSDVFKIRRLYQR